MKTLKTLNKQQKKALIEYKGFNYREINNNITEQ